MDDYWIIHGWFTRSINIQSTGWENDGKTMKIITGYFMGNIMEYGDETWHLKQFLGQWTGCLMDG